MDISGLQRVLQNFVDLELAVLVGSRANGSHHDESDWDLALQWNRDLSMIDVLGSTETLRRELAAELGVDEGDIDLIDMPGANLTMRALIAEEGLPLKGEDLLAWNHFLARTWRELEFYAWEIDHAA